MRSAEWIRHATHPHSEFRTPHFPHLRRSRPRRCRLPRRAVILTTGTFLQAIMHTGENQTPGGRAGEGTTAGISGALKRLGFRVGTLQNRHALRLNGRTIDYSQCERQPGDDDPQPFSVF